MFLIDFFKVVLYQPMLNLLILLYTYIPGHDFGIAVIILTLLIKFALFPSSRKSVKAQKAMSELQPKIKDLQNKHRDDKAAQTKAMMELYKQAKVSPMSGCLPLLLQLPILIALYQVFLNGLKPEALSTSLYSFTPFPGALNPSFLGVIDLFKPFMGKIGEQTIYYWPVLVLAIVAAAIQFIQSKQMSGRVKAQKTNVGQGKAAKGGKQVPDFSSTMQKQMLYFLPLLTIFIIVKFGSIIGIYWITSALFAIAEHRFIAKKDKDKGEDKNFLPPTSIMPAGKGT